MMGNNAAKNIDVVILCGGMGKRLRGVVADRPKPMADVNGRPFLDILIDHVSQFGFRRFILSAGYKSGVIKNFYENKRCSLDVLVSEENTPLGTGGGIKKAEHLVNSASFLVMNGDSFCDVDLRKFIEFHLTKDALLSMVLAGAQKKDDYGNVKITDSCRVEGFDEKAGEGLKKRGYINAGVYLFKRDVFAMMPEKQKFSVERDLFPLLVGRSFYGYVSDGMFVDIGMPERYEKAQTILKRFSFK